MSAPSLRRVPLQCSSRLQPCTLSLYFILLLLLLSQVSSAASFSASRNSPGLRENSPQQRQTAFSLSLRDDDPEDDDEDDDERDDPPEDPGENNVPILPGAETPTPSPSASSVASPTVSPVSSPIASITASGVPSPIASPIESPMASPMASSIASPIASPVASPMVSPIASPIASLIASPPAATLPDTATGTPPPVPQSSYPPNSPFAHLYVNTAKPGTGGLFITQPVFKTESLQAPFNSCFVDPSSKRKSSRCFKDDYYNDRIMFQLSFLSPPEDIAEAFRNTPPVLRYSVVQGVAQPAIEFAHVDVANSKAEVVVHYNCDPNPPSGRVNKVIGLILDVVLEKTAGATPLRIQWRKSCTTGRNRKIDFGYLATDKASVTQHHSLRNDAAAAAVFGPADASTEFYMKLTQPGAQQAFLAPYITSSNPGSVGISVRGNHPGGGVVKGLVDTSFQVSYDCKSKGDATIQATVGIPPFDNITTQWTKDCGGKRPRNLQVGSALNGFDIVDAGQPTPRYMVGIDNIGTAHSEEHLHIPGNQSDWTFYIRNNDTMPGSQASDADMHIGHITPTVEHQNVLSPIPPEVYEKTPFGWRVMNQSPYPLSAGATLRVRIHLVCRAQGESRILITVPVLGYNALEFGLAKECDHGGMALRSSEFVLTVGDVFFIALGLLLLSGACLYMRRRRAAKAGFSRLPTTES